MEHVKRVRVYVRGHKTQVATLTIVAVSLASRYVPGLPAEDIVRAALALVGLA